MKVIYMFLIFMVTILSVNAQYKFSDSINVYSISLKEHVDYLRNQAYNKSMQQSKIIYIQAEEQVAEKLPMEIYDYKIIFLNQKQIKEKAKRDFLPLIVIRPIELQTDGFIIKLIDFIVVYKNRNLNYSNSGGSQFEFKYDCEKERFILKNKLQGGI